MAWTTPRSYTDGEILDAATLDTHIRDNLDYLNDNKVEGYRYAPTMADVENTVTETTVLSATIANAMADGDALLILYNFRALNNEGSTRTVKMDVSYGGVEGDLFDTSMSNSATIGRRLLALAAFRDGNNMSVGIAHGIEANDLTTLATVQGAALTAPTFTAGQIFALKVTLEVADSNFYLRENNGVVIHFSSA